MPVADRGRGVDMNTPADVLAWDCLAGFDWLEASVWVIDPETGERRWANTAGLRLWGTLGLHDPLSRDEAEAMGIRGAECGLSQAEALAWEWSLPVSGRRWSLRSRCARIRAPDERPLLAMEIADVTERDETRRRLSNEKSLLEMISRNRPLKTVLRELVAGVERECPGMMCAVHEVRDGRLYGLAAPSLDKPYSAALEGLAIGPGVGSCGTAAHSRRRVIVTDIATDPRWKDYRSLALAHGLRACWSIPILGAESEVLGTFAAYYRTPRAPTDENLRVIEAAKHIAGIALERRRAENALVQGRELLQMILDAMPMLIAYADADQRYRFVNRAFEEWFGTSREVALGRSSRDIIGDELYERIRPMLERVGRGEEVRFEEQRIDARGRVRHVDVRLLPHREAGGRVSGHFGIVTDITDRKESERKLQHLATHDQLTQLPNRVLIGESLQLALARSRRTGHRLAVLFLDLDHFKEVNDSLGHEVGDRLLLEVASRLKDNVRASDAIGRLGGDEFIVVLDGIHDRPEAAALAWKLLHVIEVPAMLDGHELRISASVGIAIAPEDGGDPATLLKHADIAMYRVKQHGRHGVGFYAETGLPAGSPAASPRAGGSPPKRGGR